MNLKNNTMKNINIKTALLTVTLVCFGITFSNAQEKGERPKKPPTYKELLKEMDANEDGKLSADEVKGPLKDDFAKIDADEDGFISEAELKKAPKPKGREKRANK